MLAGPQIWNVESFTIHMKNKEKPMETFNFFFKKGVYPSIHKS